MARIVLDLPDEQLHQLADVAARVYACPVDEMIRNWLLLDARMHFSSEVSSQKSLAWRGFLNEEPDGIGIVGSRIRLEHVLERYLFKNQTPTELSESLGLSLAQIDAAIAYFQERPVEATSYLANFMRKRKEFERQLEQASPVGLKNRVIEGLQLKEQDHDPAPLG